MSRGLPDATTTDTSSTATTSPRIVPRPTRTIAGETGLSHGCPTDQGRWLVGPIGYLSLRRGSRNERKRYGSGSERTCKETIRERTTTARTTSAPGQALPRRTPQRRSWRRLAHDGQSQAFRLLLSARPFFSGVSSLSLLLASLAVYDASEGGSFLARRLVRRGRAGVRLPATRVVAVPFQ